MNTSKAKELKMKIEVYYKGSFINYPALIEYLKNGKIDNGESGLMHSGYTVPYQDYYPAIFSFDDDSILIVSGYDLIVAKEEK